MGCSTSKDVTGSVSPSEDGVSLLRPSTSLPVLGRSSSRHVQASASSQHNNNKKQQQQASSTQRERIDSWGANIPHVASSSSTASVALNQIHEAASQDHNNHSSEKNRQSGTIAALPQLQTTAVTASHMPSVEQQWKQLWESHSSQICDPQDVHAVIDGCLCSMVTLSPSETQLLQRRIRRIVQKLLDNDVSNNPSAVSTVTSAIASSSDGATPLATNTTTAKKRKEARAVVDKFRSLNESLLTLLLPSSGAPILSNLFLLTSLLGSEVLWDRVAVVAIESDKLTKEQQHQQPNEDGDMLKERSANRQLPYPKPSLVIPHNIDPLTDAQWPLGTTLTSLCAVLSMGLKGTRTQKLNLLFYLCVEQLKDFLSNHPGGGIPAFLLEVDQPVVLSTASLTHYHYYGNTYQPSSSHSLQQQRSANIVTSFVESKSRPAPRLSISHLANVLKVAGSGVAVAAPAKITSAVTVSAPVSSSSSHHGTGSSHHLTINTTLSGVPRENDSNHSHSSSNTIDNALASSWLSPSPRTVLQRMTQTQPVQEHTELLRLSNDLLVHCQPQTPGAPSSSSSTSQHGISTSLWTIQQFDHWASHALADNSLLDELLHRLLGQGLLPSPTQEKQWVQESWRSYLQYSATMWRTASSDEGDEHHEHDSGSSPKESLLSATISSVLEYSSATCGVGGNNNNGSTNKKTKNATNSSNVRMNGSSHTSPAITTALNGDEKSKDQTPRHLALNAVWGGLGGIDGGGGMGHGVLYCVPKRWWDAWAAYVKWSWVGDRVVSGSASKASPRPGALSTEPLLDRQGDAIGGTLGSYEFIKHGVQRNIDYVLVPPGVWDLLYELYGGGPPLPRMVKPFSRKFTDTNRTTTDMTGENASYHDMAADLDNIVQNLEPNRVLPLPDHLSVVLHPWVLHVHLCDPLQPYRRGDAGPLSIRVMATPDQPLWRLFAEVIGRFPLQAHKAFLDYQGKGRLWKLTDRSTGNKDPVSRYGPWNLLCKSRHATLPLLSGAAALKEICKNYDDLVDNWKQYADNATVESIGLTDQDHVLLEFAVLNKSGELHWPREAAAKAGRVRRLAEEDMKFRRVLQGVDDNGALMLKTPDLVGMEIDAMDSTGRWYPVTILEADILDDDSDEELDRDEGSRSSNGRGGEKANVSRKKVRVDFKEFGGHEQWIDVESDQLAVRGRFTSDAERQIEEVDDKSTTNAVVAAEVKPKAALVGKKSNNENGAETNKICPWPGYGACGLSNLGNTCYINSAVQCISYLPLLRSYLLSAQYKCNGDLNRDNPLGTGGKLLEEFAELLRAQWSARLGEKSPTKFRGQLGKINSQFSGADQQDAQEFLNYILDVLHEDSNKVRKKPYVEALDDDWVAKTALSRVADEAWRRFLRRNRSIMTDVAMGQVLNTVTCPVCQFSSRNFDPFNLLSIPIPTVADVVFKCIVFRRATSLNCPWVLNKPRKGEKSSVRFVRKASSSPSGPPSEHNLTEQYVVAMSRLADSGDLRLQLQNCCGIPANQLRLCRLEEVVINENGKGSRSVVSSQLKVTPLADKEGPRSSLVKKRLPGEESAAPVTMIVAFETTLRPRLVQPPPAKEEAEVLEDTADEEDEVDVDDDRMYPSPKEQEQLKVYLDVYGDEKECRFVDTNPLIIAKAISRSLWPRTEKEFKLGLRVDARDHLGNWFPGNVVEVIEGESNGGDTDTGEVVAIQTRKVKVHFDNFSAKWDEIYSIEHFEAGTVRPLYSHASPRPKPTEFLVHNRHTDRTNGHSVVFGQSFYVQCMNDWSNARAGAHILAQASRFLRHDSEAWGSGALDDPEVTAREGNARRLYEKTQTAISDVIDLLVDFDREYIKFALGVSEHNRDDESVQPFRNPAFDPTPMNSLLLKRISAILSRLPFEVRVCTVESAQSDKQTSSEEIPFPYSLNRTIGNYLNARHALLLQWREPPVDKKTGYSRYNLDSPVMYVEPKVEIDKSSAEILAKAAALQQKQQKLEATNRNTANSAAASTSHGGGGGSAGIDLGVCLAEFCKAQNLSLADNWKCPHCKKFREGQQRMNLWRLPDLLTFHIKRFNMSARWREKITTKVNFPLTGLDMSEWCHQDESSSASLTSSSGDSYVYDLIGVVNHYGSMTGGHYVAICKATACSRDGREENALSFNGVGAHEFPSFVAGGPNSGSDLVSFLSDEPPPPPPPSSLTSVGWRLGRAKTEAVNPNKVSAQLSSQSISESAEPLWLQFDDELVEPIPPQSVVSENAYVLFYRRRRITPSNLTKYSTLD